MKIDQLLLELAPKQIPAAAQALKQRRLDRAAPKPVGQGVIPNVSNPAVGMATTQPQPTTMAAPAAAQPAAPAADANGRIEPTLGDIRKNAGLPAAQEPEQLQATPAEEPAAPKKSFMQKAGDAAQGLSNIIQKGAANAGENIPAISNYAGNLAKNTEPGVSQVAKSTGNLAKSVGSAAKDVGGAVGDVGHGVDAAAQGLGKGVGGIGQGIGHAATGLAKGVQGVGDLAGSVAGAVTNPIGGLVGGIKRGFNNATGGVQSSGGAGSSAIRRVAGIGGAGGSGGGANDELSQLQATIQQMDQRLRKGGL